MTDSQPSSETAGVLLFSENLETVGELITIGRELASGLRKLNKVAAI